MYYINLSDSGHARSYLDKLNVAHDKGKGLSSSLQPSSNLNLSDLNDTVKFLEVNKQQGLQNTRGSSKP